MSPASNKPLVAITLGDPTGIGPEITAKALGDSRLWDCARPIVIGSPSILRRALQLIGSTFQVESVTSKDLSLWAHEDFLGKRTIACLATGPDDWSDLKPIVMAKGGVAAHSSLFEATQLAIEGQVDAIVTCPLHKVALHLAGHDWPGHTELLSHFCRVKDHAMMLYLPPREPKALAWGLGQNDQEPPGEHPSRNSSAFQSSSNQADLPGRSDHSHWRDDRLVAT
jgi:4-hydroxy-L-threonine phosphate dehydrogenase PdxA